MNVLKDKQGDIPYVEILPISKACKDNGDCSYRDLYSYGFDLTFSVVLFFSVVATALSMLFRIIKDAGDD